METINNHCAFCATHPGSILKYELEERQISQKNFAEMLGMQRSHLNELIRGKRPITQSIANRIEEVLGISSVSLMNLQNGYEYDKKIIEERGIEEQFANNNLKLYNELFDVSTFFKRLGMSSKSAIEKMKYLTEVLLISKPEKLKIEANGLFKKSTKTGQDARMLMTWKLLAETKAKMRKVDGIFDINNRDNVIKSLVEILHKNENTENSVSKILSNNGIVFCIEEKVDIASVDGYSFVNNGTPCIVLTKRYNRIGNFAFSLMHELGHIYLHYYNKEKDYIYKLNIQDVENDSFEEREANEFASNALISNWMWKNSPKVRLNTFIIQKEYTKWANEKGFNKWIVLGRISHETGMYKFKSDEYREIM